MNDESEPWYGVKMLFHEPGYHFEERVVVVQATDFDDAQRKGIEEAIEYTTSLNSVRFIAIIDTFHIFENPILESNVEVYSIITKSKLKPDEYLKARYENYDGEVVYRYANS